MVLLAHSAPTPGEEPQPYAAHVRGVAKGAVDNAEVMLGYAAGPCTGVLAAIRGAALHHDLGKSDPAIQDALRTGRSQRLPWDHVDAGVAHLWAQGNEMAAWLVRAHHPPGLPSMVHGFRDDGPRLRGGRNEDPNRRAAQIAHTDRHLASYLAAHEAEVGRWPAGGMKAVHGLTMRLALSCMVDADHADSAEADGHPPLSDHIACRWEERLAALDRYVADLAKNDSGTRRAERAVFYDACRNPAADGPMVSCEAPVGLGKTTAVMAYMLGRAIRRELRHIIVVAPYTSIITQTVAVLREALLLEGEDPARVVAEHHHRADFSAAEDRGFASLWRAPIVVTTAVQFFETLASNHPGRLRKLHELPGSGIIIDEAHAALPVALWPQNWRWLRELATSWRCEMAFSSGSLVRFWENRDIVDEPTEIPELLPACRKQAVFGAENRRVRYERAGAFDSVTDLISFVLSKTGPRLVIVNTVQTAAVLAGAMRRDGHEVVHLSTALCPIDRDRILAEVQTRLQNKADRDWTLVATSCVEAGVDVSFRTPFRERFSTASLIQIGGRANRHGEYDDEGGSVVFDFVLRQGTGTTANPAANSPAEVLKERFRLGEVGRMTPADLVTRALAAEIRNNAGKVEDLLGEAERQRVRDYPKVNCLGRVIRTDTRFVVVDRKVARRLRAGEKLRSQEIVRGSVQMYGKRLEQLRLRPLPGRQEIYCWPEEYDYSPDFLGYMAEVLKQRGWLQAGLVLIG